MTEFTVNGQAVRYSGESRTHLADFLREEMGLTATHVGCEQGVCGACTLVKDGKPVRSCITYAAACEGASIRTLEDYRDDALMARIRAAFKAHHGLQCGFCTPGMLATAYDIVTRLPQADEVRIREELAGNLCRCTGYMGIVAAIKAVVAEGPHVVPEPPARPAVIASSRLGPAVEQGTGTKAAVAAQPATPSMAARPEPLTGGHRLERVAMLDLPAKTVWAVLRDIRQVAACMPGASIESVEGEQVTGAMAAKIGPITARFGGTAFVTYDADDMRGAVAGQGGDGSSRSTARGEVHFALSPSSAESCELACEIIYKLSGPLAQVGRPAIVAGVVDRLVADFSANVEAAARGEAPGSAQAPSFARLILAALRNMFRRST